MWIKKFSTFLFTFFYPIFILFPGTYPHYPQVYQHFCPTPLVDKLIYIMSCYKIVKNVLKPLFYLVFSTSKFYIKFIHKSYPHYPHFPQGVFIHPQIFGAILKFFYLCYTDLTKYSRISFNNKWGVEL